MTDSKNLPKKTTTNETNISTIVLDKVNAFKSSGELKLPDDYSPENALKSAYLILAETKNKQGQFALTHCTQESIANSLLKMVVYGLSPLKKQCDLIMYGNKLDCTIEYTGNIALAKRYAGMKDIVSNAVFKDDIFEFKVDVETGRKTVTKHEQKLENLSKPVVGAYAVVIDKDGNVDTEIMDMGQIKNAWNQGAMKGNSPAHRNFPDQMSIKTVINRATKLLIRGSNDVILNLSASDKDGLEENTIDVAEEDMKHEIGANANAEEISFEEVKEAPPEKSKEEVDAENEKIMNEAIAEENKEPIADKTGQTKADF